MLTVKVAPPHTPSVLFQLTLRPIRSVTSCPELPGTVRGVQKHHLTFGKGQISHSACLWALGTKATEFTSFNCASAFVLGNGGLGVGPATDQPLLECTVRGSQTSGPPALWLMCPNHVTCTAACAHTHTHEHSTLPSTFSRIRRTIPLNHIKQKSPQLVEKSNGFTPKDGSSGARGLKCTEDTPLSIVDIVRWKILTPNT